MRQMSRANAGLLTAGIWLAFQAGVPGQMVGLNFSGGTVGDPGDPPTEVTRRAGAFDDLEFRQDNWNNLPGASGADAALIDDSGALKPGMQVSWHSDHTGTGPNEPVFSEDDVLMYAYIDDTASDTPAGPGTEGCWVTVSNIPYSTYHVVIYGASRDTTPGRPLGGYAVAKTDGRLMSRTVYGGHPYVFDGLWFRMPPDQVDRDEVSENPDTLEGNHVVIPNLTDPDIMVLGLRSPAGGTGSRASIAAIQIVEADGADTDMDSLPDQWERIHFGNLGFSDADDPDGDQLSNADELAHGSNPNLMHSDTDSLTDLEDVRVGFSPILADTSGNGISDFESIFTGPDTDGDGLYDLWEQAYFGTLDPTPSGDPDNDTRTNLQEQNARTNPTVAEAAEEGPRIVDFQIDRSGGTYLLTWGSISEKAYRVESTGDPEAGNWTLEPGSTVTATGDLTSHSGAISTSDTQYRVVRIEITSEGPRIVDLQIDPVGGTYTLSWTSTSDTTYVVEATGDPGAGDWSRVPGSTVTATGALTSHSGTFTPGNTTYRVIENPDP